MMTTNLHNYRTTVLDVDNDDEWQVEEVLREAGRLGEFDADLDYYLPGGDLWLCDPDYHWSSLDGIMTPFAELGEYLVGMDSLVLTRGAMDDSVSRAIAEYLQWRAIGSDLPEGLWTRMEIDEVEAGVPPIMAKGAIGWTDLCRIYAIANGCDVIAYRGGRGYVYGIWRKEVAP